MFRREDLEEELGIEYADQDTVLRESDFVSLHTPYMPATHHLISHDQLKMMKNTAVLVNSSRGPVVDPDALYEALRDGEIDSAGLDVTDPEPLPADHRLLTLENCLVVPHIASASYETRAAMSQLAAENIVAVLGGKKPATPVNPEVVEAQGLPVVPIRHDSRTPRPLQRRRSRGRRPLHNLVARMFSVGQRWNRAGAGGQTRRWPPGRRPGEPVQRGPGAGRRPLLGPLAGFTRYSAPVGPPSAGCRPTT